MKVNEIYDVEVIDDNQNGNGICKIEGIPVFIKNAVTNDLLRIRITKVMRKYAYGEVISFFKKSSNRIESECKYYDKCGGCNLMHVPYEREIKTKEIYLKRLFGDKLKGIVSLDRYNYRNKVTLHVDNGRLGLYDEQTNNLICIEKCKLLDKRINDLIKVLSSFDLSRIDEIVIRKGDKDLLLHIIGDLDERNIEQLKQKKEITIYKNDELIFGNQFIVSSVGNLKYLVNHRAFFQVNSKCCYKLYEEIKSEVSKSDRLLDLYCGIGSIGLYLSDICNKVVGVEINKESVKCAIENIKLNNIKNYEVFCGDASIICDSFDTVVVDPPRSGLSKMVIDNIIKMRPRKLIYISCNPSTLKRDISLLDGYELITVKGFNMFPCTKHVECLAVLYLK